MASFVDLRTTSVNFLFSVQFCSDLTQPVLLFRIKYWCQASIYIRSIQYGLM